MEHENADGRSVFDLTAPPSGTGCVDCLAADGWWVHLRRCAACGHIGCCDTSPGQHATAPHGSSGHPVIRSFEPGRTGSSTTAPAACSTARSSRPRPATHAARASRPAGAVPADWQDHLH